MRPGDYAHLKSLVLKSAKDFLTLYQSVPAKDQALKAARPTFYGQMPVTASAMYAHIKGVNRYYFASIGLALTRNEDLQKGLEEGFTALEGCEGYLDNALFEGSDGESWSLRKVLRRFLWHDTIHAKALYRSAVQAFPDHRIANPFCFLL